MSEWPTDAVQSVRSIKILGRPELEGYERTIWMDNSTVFLSDPSFLLEYGDDAPSAHLNHSYRDTVAEEFDEVMALGYDDQGRVLEQLNADSLVNKGVLEQRPFASTMMVRRRSSELAVDRELEDARTALSEADEMNEALRLESAASRHGLAEVEEAYRDS